MKPKQPRSIRQNFGRITDEVFYQMAFLKSKRASYIHRVYRASSCASTLKQYCEKGEEMVRRGADAEQTSGVKRFYSIATGLD